MGNSSAQSKEEKLEMRVKELKAKNAELKAKNAELKAKNEKLEADVNLGRRLLLEPNVEGAVEIKCADGVTYRGDDETLKGKSGYFRREGKIDCLTDVAASGVKLVLLRLLCAEKKAFDKSIDDPSALLGAITTVARLEINDEKIFRDLTQALGRARHDADHIVAFMANGLSRRVWLRSAQNNAIVAFLRNHHGFLTQRDLLEQLPLAVVARFLECSEQLTGQELADLETVEDRVDISFSKSSSTMEDGWDSLVESDNKSGWRAALVITKDGSSSSETPIAQHQDDDDDDVVDATPAETAKVKVEVSIFPRRKSQWKSIEVVIRSGKKEFIVDADKAAFASPSIPVATIQVPFVSTVSDLKKIERLDVAISPVASRLQKQVDFITAWAAAKQSLNTTTPCGALTYLEGLDNETEDDNDDATVRYGSGDTKKKAVVDGLDDVRWTLVEYVTESLYLSSGTDTNELSASAMHRVLAQKNLRVTNAPDEEPELAVLKVALQWAKARGEHLNDVLDVIRLPFIPLTDLHRDDYNLLKLCPKFKLLGAEAIDYQYTRKRPRTDDGIARCEKRLRGLDAPEINATDLMSLVLER